MSQGFGIDIYGIPFYGYSQPQDYSVTPFTATQADYGEIVLQWSSPNTTSWKLLHLVRSVYGYPSTSDDGVLLQEIVPGTIQKTYDDAGLTPGTIYYYTIFLTVEAPTWSAATTYPINAQVLYNGQYWNSSANGNINHTPTAGGTFWTPSAYIPTWYPAGYAATIALANNGYGTLLYNRTPQPYKISGSDTFGNSSVDNPALQHYLNVFGFGLDLLKNRYDSLLELNDVDTVSATYLDILGQQFGIDTDYMSTPQQRRQRIKNAAVNYEIKGEPQSIHNIIAQLAGWDSIITSGTNMYNNPDQAEFASPHYDMWNSNTTYFPNQLIQYNGYNYKNLVQSVGTAQSPTGANSSNTWWSVQTQVLDTTVSLNPETGSFSTWQVVGTGAAASSTGVLTGLPHPTNTAINNANALNVVQTTNFLTGTVDIYTTSALSTPNWASGTNYKINNYVLYTDGYYYQALKPSGPGTPYGAITPGTNSTFWKAFYFTVNDRPNVIRDGAPIAIVPTWNATTTYQVGTQIQFNGILYQASITNINSQPTGFYYSNAAWVMVQPMGGTSTMSVYAAKLGVSPCTLTLGSNYFDRTGTLIKNYSSHYSNYQVGVGVTARFINDFADLNTTTEASFVNFGFNTSSNWASTPSTANLWYTKYGMAAVNQTIAGTTQYIYTVVDNTGNISPWQGRWAMTFANDYVDTTHKTHGIVFAMQNSTNFWFATRQGLWKVVSGTATKVLTYTRLLTGDRIVVDSGPSAIDVYKYARDKKGTLTLLGSVTTNLPTAGGMSGMIQQYSATGAL